MPRPTEENGCHSDSWFSLHLLVRHSCWGAKTRDQGETEGLAVGWQGPWGFPWCGCSEHRLMELGGLHRRLLTPPCVQGPWGPGSTGQITQHDLMGQTLAPPPCSPCGLHPGSPTHVAPAVHTPAPHTLTDASCNLCVQHAHQHGGLRGQHAPLPGLNICLQCAHSLPPNPLAFHPRACLQMARGRGTHGCLCTPTSSPKHCYHCRACCQLCFPDLVSDSHAVQAPAAPRRGVRGSPDSQLICPCDRSLS